MEQTISTSVSAIIRHGNGIIFPEDENITLKKALKVSAFRNETKFRQFLESCNGNTDFSKKLLEEIQRRSDFKKILDSYLELNGEFTA